MHAMGRTISRFSEGAINLKRLLRCETLETCHVLLRVKLGLPAPGDVSPPLHNWCDVATPRTSKSAMNDIWLCGRDCRDPFPALATDYRGDEIRGAQATGGNRLRTWT